VENVPSQEKFPGKKRLGLVEVVGKSAELLVLLEGMVGFLFEVGSLFFEKRVIGTQIGCEGTEVKSVLGVVEGAVEGPEKGGVRFAKCG